MRTEVTVRTEDVLAKLQPLAKQHKLDRLSDLGKIVPDFEIDATVDVDAVAGEAGYVNAEKYRQNIVEDMEANVSDLRDGLRALIEGDLSMANILLCRAFDEWEDARLAVEEVVLGRTVHDHRQFALLAA